MKRVALGGLTLAMLAGAAMAAEAPAWTPFHSVDPVTDQTRDGLAYEDGEDSLRVVCTHQKELSARQRFWIEVKTGAALGRANRRNLTYRVGDEPATTSRWDYTPRAASPSWPLEDRHLVERIVDHKAERVVFRLSTYDGLVHDVTVPVDAAARELMAQTIARCRS